mgnify:FL=1
MSNVFFNLSCSFDASSFHNANSVCTGEERILQYSEGFKIFFNFYKNYYDRYEDVYIVDNTLKDISHVDKRIKNEIPANVNIIFTQKNEHGKLNKGAGILENWMEVESLASNYEFVFHFEPRLKLKSTKIFDQFAKEKKTTFLSHKEKLLTYVIHIPL